MKRKLVLLLAIVLLASSCFELYRIVKEYKSSEAEYDTIREWVKQPFEETKDGKDEQSLYKQYETEGTIMALPGIALSDLIAVHYERIDFEKLCYVNPDVVAWIVIEGTCIDYPVVQGEDNEEYIRKTVTGEFNNAGSIFVDYRVATPFGVKNTIIHGHNQRNRAMFHDLSYYTNEEFFQTNKYIVIYLPNGICSTYEIYSFYETYSISETYDCHYVGKEYETYLAYTQQQSWYETTVALTPEDEIITLSTCTNEWDGGRYVIHGKKVCSIGR